MNRYECERSYHGDEGYMMDISHVDVFFVRLPTGSVSYTEAWAIDWWAAFNGMAV
jgi:hypothetical protein